jgi:hypothetical protein
MLRFSTVSQIFWAARGRVVYSCKGKVTWESCVVWQWARCVCVCRCVCVLTVRLVDCQSSVVAGQPWLTRQPACHKLPARVRKDYPAHRRSLSRIVNLIYTKLGNSLTTTPAAAHLVESFLSTHFGIDTNCLAHFENISPFQHIASRHLFG